MNTVARCLQRLEEQELVAECVGNEAFTRVKLVLSVVHGAIVVARAS
jgi:hypothetical protein